jgi:predicted phage terminase large subunit-like protein
MGIKEDLRAELRRREARGDLLSWCEYALEPVAQTPAAHHRLLIGELAAVARGETQRLMITMPPGSAKSTYISIYFPSWFMAQTANRAVVAASHTSDLAEGFSRRLMGVIREYGDVLGYGLATESVAGWETTNGGVYRAVGVGGPVTGRRADLLIIDDPVKSRAQADSPIERERVWNWFTADLLTRLRPGGCVVLVMTRWHEDDLAGRLLQAQSERWKLLNLPAIAGENDPLGRAPGEWLWNDDAYGYATALQSQLKDYETLGGLRDWESLYQQNPRPGTGALFKTHMISKLDAAPEAERYVRGWDLAATKNIGSRDADWTVGLRLARSKAGSYVVEDLVRLRGGPDEVDAAILATAQRDGVGVEISLPQDPAAAGKARALQLVKMLAGYRVSATLEGGDKATRAAGVASQVNVGNVAMTNGHWNAAFVDELSGFPSTRHDDIVDALARAFNSMAPLIKGAAMLEIARRQMAEMKKTKEEVEKPKPRWQPGCVEWFREQAEIASKS